MICLQPVAPAAHLGFEVGADRKLANWQQITSYFYRIAEQSDRILVEEIGRSTEGRPMLLVTISAPANLARLDYYRSIQEQLADPRRLTEEQAAALIEEGKTICLLTCSIHASEVGASQMSMELAYDLITQDDPVTHQILDNVIFLLVPSLNPDGLDLVVKWYEASLGKPYEGILLPELYQKYAGHDNNRDWFMANLVENRLVIEKIHNVWRPHIVQDQHQQSSEGPRFVLPPFIDPYDANVDPILRGMVNWLGMSIASEMNGRGFKGVVTNLTYDAFSPSRAYQHYHGGVRILSEAASVRLASPVRIEQLREVRGFDPRVATWNHPQPWTGGEWRLRDIVDYDKACAWACLRHAARYRDSWVSNFYRIHKNAVEYNEAPFAFIIPLDQDDPATAAEMLDVLMLGGVEIKRATEAFTQEGISYPSGTFVIPLNQPYGRYAKTLLEAQPYPDLRVYPGGPPRRPYDITAHSLPLQMGVKVVAANIPLQVQWEPLEQVPRAIGEPCRFQLKSTGEALLIDPRSNQSYKIVYRAMQAGASIARTVTEVADFPVGSFVVKAPASLQEQIARDCAQYGVGYQSTAPELPSRQLLRLPRVGLYQGSIPNADEGWTRYVFDGYGIPYVSLGDAEIRQGDALKELDCLILPSAKAQAIANGLPTDLFPPEFSGGLGASGAERVLQFVERGGTLVALDGACDWAIQNLWLPVRNVLTNLPPEQFYVPGSFLRVLFHPEHPISYGLARETNVVFLHSPAFDFEEGVLSVASYPLQNPLVAGWILGAEHLRGKSALAEVPLGHGRVTLIGFRPQFRAQARGTYRVLFNAMLQSVLE